MHSLDPHGDDRAAELDTPLDERGEVPLRPARTAGREATAVDEDDHGQGFRARAPGVEGRRRDVEGEALGGAEAVIRVREAVLQEQVLIVDVLGVSDRQGANRPFVSVHVIRHHKSRRN